MSKKALQRFGAVVRRLRDGSGLTQAALAEKADVAVETISRVESGAMNVTLDVVERLALALGVPMTVLVGEVPKAPARSRPPLARLVAFLEPLPDADLVRVHSGLRTLLGIGRRAPRKRR